MKPSKFEKYRKGEGKEKKALIPREERPSPGAPADVPAVFQAFVPKPPSHADIPKGFEIFAPGAPSQVPAVFQAFVPKPPSEMIPKEFQAFIPTPEERARAEETHQEKEAREMALWKSLFPTSQEEERDIFGAFRPEKREEPPSVIEREPYWPPPDPFSPKPVTEAWRRTWPDVSEYTAGRMPLWVMGDYGWTMPPTAQVVETLKSYIDLNTVFEEVLNFTETHDWETVHMMPGKGYARYEIDVLTPEHLYEMMGLPTQLYLDYGYQPLGEESFWEEVLMPWFNRFTKAMDILKPRGLHGSFAFEAGAPGKTGGFTFLYEEPLREP